MRNYFPKRTSGAPLYNLSKLYDVTVDYVSPPLLRQCSTIFAVAEGWLLLDIGLFVLFMYIIWQLKFNILAEENHKINMIFCLTCITNC